MAKSRSFYVCQQCGADAPKWMGRCPSCGQWNTMVEQRVPKNGPRPGGDLQSSRSPESLEEVVLDRITRIDLQNGEFNRVLGGGLVPGSMVLIGGEPGIGKSTLALQVALRMSESTLYVSGEESSQQLKMRAKRMGGWGNGHCMVLAETSLQAILDQVIRVKPGLVIIDSIQTLQSDEIEAAPGTISQVRECAARLLRLAKQTHLPVILIGHITKEGSIAGPKVLEHIVDTVLQFEGDSHHIYRILRATKNRFGSTSEIGVFEMTGEGLREIGNPSELLINQQDPDLSGSAIAANVEGIRPILIEVQALVSSAVYGTPQRTSTGFDIRRLNMLLAVLEKRASFRLAAKDVFVNIAGGLKVDDPAIDLPLAAAILSSSADIPVDTRSCFAGEIGLSGEIRPVNRIEQRLAEADKLGMNRIFISAGHFGRIDRDRYRLQVTGVSRVQEIPKLLFG